MSAVSGHRIGSAFLLDVNLRTMSDAAKVTRVLVTGGLARADYLCQVLADVSGLPVIRSSVREATARGTAFLAAGQPESWSGPEIDRAFPPHRRAKLATRYRRWQKALEQRLLASR